MIKKRVKESMNKLLGEICLNISREMANMPFYYLDLSEFEKAAAPYLNINKIKAERKKYLATLKKIQAEAEELINDIEEKQKEEKEGL